MLLYLDGSLITHRHRWAMGWVPFVSILGENWLGDTGSRDPHCAIQYKDRLYKYRDSHINTCRKMATKLFQYKDAILTIEGFPW